LFEIQKGNILIALSGATTGKIGIYNLEYKSYLNQRVGKITEKTGVIQKYIYYWYLCCDIESTVLKMAQGTAQPNISTNNISNIKIPIPPLEKQEEIVKYLDFIYEKANKTSQEKIKELKTLNEFCLNTQKMFGENVVKTLGEVCSRIKGEKRNSKDGKEIGLYPLYYCSILGYLYLDTFDYTGEGIIINKTNGSGKAMIYFGNDKYNVGKTTLHFKSKSNIIITKYIYYYLLHNIPLIEKYFKGANQKSIVEEDLFKIKIPIPPLETQQEIVEYCEYNDTLIKQLEKEIENNKKQAEKCITSIVKTQVLEEQDDTI